MEIKESEKATERYLIKKIKDRGGLCYKWVSPNQSGVPDRICILPGGITAFIELKSEGRKLSPLQALERRDLEQVGALVLVIDTKAKVDQFIRGYDEHSQHT